MPTAPDASRSAPARWLFWSLTAALTLLSWPVRSLAPATDVDSSWMAGLHMAARQGLHFGSQVLFTHGPLGFLVSAQLWSRPTAAAAVAFAVAAQAGFCGVLLVLLSRMVRWPVAVLVVLALTRVVVRPPSELLALVLLLCCLDLVQSVRRPAHARWWVALGVVVTAVELLVKVNDGLYCLALLALTVAALSERKLRDTAAALAGCLVLVLAIWLGIGQRLGDFPAWAWGSIELTRGYQAMATEESGRLLEYVEAVVYLAVLVAMLAGSWRPRHRLACALMLVVAGFIEFEHGFVRHNRHVLGFFLVLAVLPLALRLARRARPWQFGLSAVSLVLLMLAAQDALPTYLRESVTAPARAVGQVLDLTSPSRGAAIAAKGRAELAATYQIQPRVLRALAGHTVQIDPYDTSAAWAYRLNWDPVPVFQLYSAYTPALDARDAGALRKPGAPERILRARHGDIDNRSVAYEAPEYVLTELCAYRQQLRTAGWQLLARSGNRCGTARPLGTAVLTPISSVRVPAPSAPDMVVLARLTLPTSPLDAVVSAAFKPLHTNEIVLDGGPPERLVRANAGGPLIMHVPSYAPVGPGPGGRIDVHRIELPGLSGPARVEFYEMPLAR